MHTVKIAGFAVAVPSFMIGFFKREPLTLMPIAMRLSRTPERGALASWEGGWRGILCS